MQARKMYEPEESGKVRIKQIMAVPDGYGVMIPLDDGYGNVEMVDAEDTQWVHMFALVDGGDGDDCVALVEMSGFGPGEIAEEGSCLYRKKRCTHCGKWMKPHRKQFDDGEVRFSCDCGSTGG